MPNRNRDPFRDGFRLFFDLVILTVTGLAIFVGGMIFFGW